MNEKHMAVIGIMTWCLIRLGKTLKASALNKI